MNNTVINEAWIANSILPIGGDDDYLRAKYQHIDPNDEQAVRSVIRTEIVPEIRNFTPQGLTEMKKTYRYFFAKGYRWGRIFQSIVPAIQPPDEPRRFFLWLWDECFPGEDPAIEPEGECHIVMDFDEIRRYYLRRPS